METEARLAPFQNHTDILVRTAESGKGEHVLDEKDRLAASAGRCRMFFVDGFERYPRSKGNREFLLASSSCMCRTHLPTIESIQGTVMFGGK
jgi:hypothetical protein